LWYARVTRVDPLGGDGRVPVLGRGRTNMGCGKWKVACADGFEVVSSDQHELVSLVQWHGKHKHNEDFTQDAVLKMAKHP
jgi:predicted small metal-binding protein